MMNIYKTHSVNKQSGFSLLEVLITVVILSIGLLGLAALQGIGLKNNTSAYHRSQATQLSYDIADRMRANVAGISSYVSNVPATTTAQPTCITTTGCSVGNMAVNDLFEWNAALTDVLPAGVGTISQSGSVYTISVTWDDDHDGISANNAKFETSMQP
jgi:type IV pilus assembly protein PilV